MSWPSVWLLSLSTLSLSEGLTEVGNFRNLAHGIGGKVYAKDERTLVIDGFTYDGQGPDAFFWAGTSGRPSSVGTILPHPFDGKFYEYEDRDAPILEGRFNKEEIVLTLPQTLKATDIRWLSVWCRRFAVNFGDILFPENLKLEMTDDNVVEPDDGVPPPLVGPDHNHHDDDEKYDYDAEPESKREPKAETEPESESESEPYGSASDSTASVVSIFLSAVFLLL